MDKLFLNILLVASFFLLGGCAILGSQDYYSGISKNGETSGTIERTAYLSGKPDNRIIYSIGYSMRMDIYSDISSQVYALGPLLPIVPMFGLLDESNELINITLVLRLYKSSSDSSKNIILTNANIKVNNVVIPPERIHGKFDGKYKDNITMPTILKSDLKKVMRYKLTYNQKAETTDNFILILNIEDEEGKILLKDEIAFRKSSSTSMMFGP